MIQDINHLTPPTNAWRHRRPAWRAAALALALTLLATGCSTISQRGASLPQAQQTASVRTYHHAIDLGGRLSVQYQQNGKDQAVHGSFSWSQNDERIMLSLFSPLGQTLATIELTPQQATLTQSGRPPLTATDADALAAGALGWPLPLSGLRDWLQGYARDASGMRIMATAQRDDITTSDGWHLRFVSWQDNDNASAPYPHRLDLTRKTDSRRQAGDVALRIVIDQWQPH